MELTDTATKKKGAVAVAATPDTYTVTAYSKSDHTFVAREGRRRDLHAQLVAQRKSVPKTW